MFCYKCGAENPDNTDLCAACGVDLTISREEMVMGSGAVVESAGSVTGMQTKNEAQKLDVLASAKVVLDRINPYLEKYKLFVVAAGGILALIICIVILASLSSVDNGYTAMAHSIGAKVYDGEVVIIYDNKKVKATGLEAKSIRLSQSNLDGSVLALLTDEGDLAVVTGTKLTLVDEEVRFFLLSVDGTGLGYVTADHDSYTLNLYNIRNKKNKVVSDSLYMRDTEDFALSPNGDAIAYYEQGEDDETPSLMYFKGSKSTKVTASEVTLLGLSNKGKYIYVTAKDDEGQRNLYTFDTRGNRDKIGQCSDDSVYFNDDHTQIVYHSGSYSDGYKTYLSSNGKEGKKLSSSVAYPLLPGSAQAYEAGNTATIPTDNLYNKVYLCWGTSGYNIWYLRKNYENSARLANNITNPTLSEDGKYVYYINDNALKVLTVSKGDNASDKVKVLAEDLDDYVVTSDCKKVYYTSDDALYSVNGKTGRGKKTVANDEVEPELYINAKDVVYYVKDGDAYASKNGAKGKKVVSEAELLQQTANGVVYIFAGDNFYATIGAKRPKKIFTFG